MQLANLLCYTTCPTNLTVGAVCCAVSPFGRFFVALSRIFPFNPTTDSQNCPSITRIVRRTLSVTVQENP